MIVHRKLLHDLGRNISVLPSLQLCLVRCYSQSRELARSDTCKHIRCFNRRSALIRYRVAESSVVYQKVCGDREAIQREADNPDVQMMDDRLASYWSEFLSECLAVLGTFALVAYTFPLLCLFFIPLILFFVSVPMTV
jgi:hypothetical protein